MALGAVVVLALWPVDGSSGKRLLRNKDSSDADTNGIVIGSPDVHPHYRHHGDYGGGHDGGAGGLVPDWHCLGLRLEFAG